MHNDLLKLSGTCTLNVACCCTPVTGEDERDGKLMRRTSYLMATQKTAVLDEPADEHGNIRVWRRWLSVHLIKLSYCRIDLSYIKVAGIVIVISSKQII